MRRASPGHRRASIRLDARLGNRQIKFAFQLLSALLAIAVAAVMLVAG